jgi:hypothetical protein
MTAASIAWPSDLLEGYDDTAQPPQRATEPPKPIGGGRIIDPARFPLGLPRHEPIPGTRYSVLVRPFRYVPDAVIRARVKAYESGEPYEPGEFEREQSAIINIADGFAWNGASVPRMLWPWVGSPFDPDFIAFSLVHDYDCGRAKSLRERIAADALGVEVLKYSSGIYAPRRGVIRAGVTIGALWSWRLGLRREQ